MSNYEINDLLRLVVSEQAEALMLHPGEPPVIHLRDERHEVEGPAITPDNAEELWRGLADTRQMRQLREQHQLTFVHRYSDSAQFRVQAAFRDDTVKLDLQRLEA